MEAAIGREARYRELGFGGAFVQQFRLLWTSRRPLLLGIAFVALLALSGPPWSDDPKARLFTLWPLWIFFMGPLWAFVTWHNEGPSNRLYFWSQPVSRAAHSMARVAAGAAWLWILYAFLIATGLLFAIFDGDVGQFALADAPAWVSLFTGALLGYLIISALAVPSDYPIRWFLAIAFAIPVTLTLFVEWLDLDELVRWAMTPLSDREWGLGITMIAPFADAIARLEQAVRGSGGLHRPITDPQTWWIAMPLWVLFWTAVVFLLARRHPDLYRRWRRRG